jgi:hypothetical protein
MVDVGDNDHRSAGCRSVVVYEGDVTEANPIS